MDDIRRSMPIASSPAGHERGESADSVVAREALSEVSSGSHVREAPQGVVSLPTILLTRAAKAVLFAVAFFAPLLASPITQDQLFLKVVFVEAAAALALALWLAICLFERRILYRASVLHLAFVALAAAMLAATVFSLNSWESFWGSDPTGEKLASVLAFIVLSFLASALFSRRDVMRLAAVFITSFLILGILTIVQIGVAASGGSLPAWLSVNPFGTVNALALGLGFGFVFTFGLLAGRGGRRWLTILASITALILFVDLVLLGFRLLWIGIAVVLFFAIALGVARALRRVSEGAGGVRARGMSVLFVALAAALILAFRPTPFAERVWQPPVEIAPSFASALAIGRDVIARHPALGVGPAEFALAYHQFRGTAANSTPFWVVRFTHGPSLMATLPSTLGLLGILAILGVLVAAVGTAVRALVREDGTDPLSAAFGWASVFALLLWFLYAGNFAVTLLLFLLLGALASLEAPAAGGAAASSGLSLTGRAPLALRAKDAEVTGGDSSLVGRLPRLRWPRFSFVEREIRLDETGPSFAASLAAVFGAAFALVALFALSAQYAAEISLREAQAVLTERGDLTAVKALIGRAVRLNPTDDSSSRAAAEIALASVQRLIALASADPSQDRAQEFRAEFSDGVSAAQKAVARSPKDPLNWFILGQLYEVVVPFVAGADRAAIDAYRRAAEVDPANPSLAFSEGRVHLTAYDLATLRIYQTPSGDARSRLEAERASTAADARSALTRSLELKSDYAQAHFLFAQLAIREEKLEEAITKTEDALRLAPADVGVAFQLGVLYYQAGRLDEAKAAFERALLFNEQYSNARYFLGLIWDRKGDKDAARSQFQKIAELNPDNEEVGRIIANLEAGKSALEGIAPPLPAPETRKEAPVKEGEAAGQPLRRK